MKNKTIELLEEMGYENVKAEGADDDGATFMEFFQGTFEGELYEIKCVSDVDGDGEVEVYDRKSAREDWDYVGTEEL